MLKIFLEKYGKINPALNKIQSRVSTAALILHDEEDKDKMEAIERRIKEVDVTEHVEALVNGEGDLSEEFKRKAATVFV